MTAVVVVCLQCYMSDMVNCSGQLPVGIAGREDVIFGNIVEIHEFHKKSVNFRWHLLSNSSFVIGQIICMCIRCMCVEFSVYVSEQMNHY